MADRDTLPSGGQLKARPGRYLVILLTAFIGTLASISMFKAIAGWQSHVAELRLASLAQDQSQTLNAGLTDTTDLIYSMRAYFESFDQLPTREQYQAFSRSLRERAVGLRDTGWAPRVAAADRDAFEHAIQAAGVPDFQIKERAADGKLVRAKDRAEYFPILWSDPGPANRPVQGYDIASEPMRNHAIATAVLGNRPSVTPPLKLANLQRGTLGMMGFIPVTHAAARLADAADRGTPLPVDGIILGVWETAAMIENILATKLHPAGLDMYVFNPKGSDGNRVIYWNAIDRKPVPEETSLLAATHWESTLQLADQQWGVIFRPNKAFDDGVARWTASGALLGGLLMTVSMVGYLWFSLLRTQQLERLTSSLRETTEQLQRNGAELDHMARHDALTGLANRLAFRDEASGGLRRARRGQGMALLYLDLDRFKAVNDTLGHPAGDRLLCQVASRLRDSVRDSDTITRLGGDEFAIAQYGAEQPEAAGALARRLVETLSAPYEIDGQFVVVGASVGITVADRDDTDFDQLLQRADMALYAAKRDGRGTWRFFEPCMESDARARRGLEMDLRHALEHEELELWYQPQVTIADGRVSGFEALLRWHHPDRGLVMPGDFIRCAEETGLIVPIGDWVLRTALRQAAEWPVGIRVAVNLSPYQLARDDLAATVSAALTASGQGGSRLEVEITESALIQHHTAGHATLKQLRASGVHIAMDDFGTGYASLSHLRSFPFDRLKIDQSFVAGMTESPQGAAIVRAILQLAATLDIVTTAEGVETAAQLALLVEDGCVEAQGFLFSKARPASEVPSLLAGWPPVADLTNEIGSCSSL